ncbi:MAG TPA: TylF/MycF/NovP-related O-methyltransferase [Burkholderiaceae bacterium]|nr:TylF/MycF/NovP-related O-methyltransferase [Burkholderiaceae bacterium]
MKSVDLKRVQIDQAKYSQLETTTGREALWQEIGQECANSSLIGLLEESIALPGEIIELGVYRGASILRLAHAVKSAEAKKTIYACDSFEGFPDNRLTREDTSFFRPISRLKRKFTVAQDVPDRLDAFFSAYGVDGRIVKGYFENTLPTLDIRQICFAHIDCDTYSSHIECLGYVYPRLVSGGIIVLDDYKQPKWPGATQAVDEFFADKPESVNLSEARPNNAWYVRKV